MTTASKEMQTLICLMTYHTAFQKEKPNGWTFFGFKIYEGKINNCFVFGAPTKPLVGKCESNVEGNNSKLKFQNRIIIRDYF